MIRLIRRYHREAITALATLLAAAIVGLATGFISWATYPITNQIHSQHRDQRILKLEKNQLKYRTEERALMVDSITQQNLRHAQQQLNQKIGSLEQVVLEGNRRLDELIGGTTKNRSYILQIIGRMSADGYYITPISGCTSQLLDTILPAGITPVIITKNTVAYYDRR